MKKLVFLLIFSLVPGLARASETEISQLPTASQEVLKRLEDKIQNLLEKDRLAKQAAKRAERLNAEERKKAADAMAANALALQEARTEMKKLQDSIARQERNAVDDRLRYERSIRYVIGGLTATFVAIVLLAWFLLRKNHTATLQPTEPEGFPDVLIDPDIQTLRKVLASSRSEQKFVKTFHDGQQFKCMAKLDGPKVVARYEGDPEALFVSFDKLGRRINRFIGSPAA